MTMVAFITMMFGGPLILISFLLCCGFYKIPLFGKDYNRSSAESTGGALLPGGAGGVGRDGQQQFILVGGGGGLNGGFGTIGGVGAPFYSLEQPIQAGMMAQPGMNGGVGELGGAAGGGQQNVQQLPKDMFPINISNFQRHKNSVKTFPEIKLPNLRKLSKQVFENKTFKL